MSLIKLSNAAIDHEAMITLWFLPSYHCSTLPQASKLPVGPSTLEHSLWNKVPSIAVAGQMLGTFSSQVGWHLFETRSNIIECAPRHILAFSGKWTTLLPEKLDSQLSTPQNPTYPRRRLALQQPPHHNLFNFGKSI